MSPSFDLRLLPSFVAVAQELHFGRAAQRLYIAQPALSRQIAKLEQQVGTVLLNRTSRGVELTPDGRAFLDAALDILQHAARAEAAAQADNPELRVHLGDGEPPDVLALVQTISASTTLPMTVLDGIQSESSRAVSEGWADVGFDILEGVPGGLAYAPVSRHRFGVMCTETHRLARSPAAVWADLDGVTIVVAPPGVNDGYNLALNAALRHNAVSCDQVVGPRLRPNYLQTYLSQGDRVLVCGEFIMAPRMPGMCWVPLEPEIPLEFGVVWNDDSPDARTRLFVDEVRRRSAPAVERTSDESASIGSETVA